MDIKDAEEKLFSEWSVRRKKIVRDGIVSESDYEGSRIKILYLLKEAVDNEEKRNSEDNRFKNLIEFIRNGARSKTWDNLTRWTIGIRQLPTPPNFSELPRITNELRREELRSICFMNLKKEAGDSTSRMFEIEQWATEDWSNISKQISLYDPDLIVCGGTGAILRNLMQQDRQVRAEDGYFVVNRRCIVVEYCHPEKRFTRYEKLYTELMEVLVHILENERGEIEWINQILQKP